MKTLQSSICSTRECFLNIGSSCYVIVTILFSKQKSLICSQPDAGLTLDIFNFPFFFGPTKPLRFFLITFFLLVFLLLKNNKIINNIPFVLLHTFTLLLLPSFFLSLPVPLCLHRRSYRLELVFYRWEKNKIKIKKINKFKNLEARNTRVEMIVTRNHCKKTVVERERPNQKPKKQTSIYLHAVSCYIYTPNHQKKQPILSPLNPPVQHPKYIYHHPVKYRMKVTWFYRELLISCFVCCSFLSLSLYTPHCCMSVCFLFGEICYGGVVWGTPSPTSNFNSSTNGWREYPQFIYRTFTLWSWRPSI